MDSNLPTAGMESTPKHLSRVGMARTLQNAHSSREHTLRISELWSESGKLNAFKCDAPNDRRQLPIKHNPGFVPPAGKVKNGKLTLEDSALWSAPRICSEGSLLGMCGLHTQNWP